jgi:hypothetical protein
MQRGEGGHIPPEDDQIGTFSYLQRANLVPKT